MRFIEYHCNYVLTFMYNNRPAKDGVGATEQGQVVANVEASSARQPSLYVTQVSNVSCLSMLQVNKK